MLMQHYEFGMLSLIGGHTVIDVSINQSSGRIFQFCRGKMMQRERHHINSKVAVYCIYFWHLISNYYIVRNFNQSNNRNTKLSAAKTLQQ